MADIEKIGRYKILGLLGQGAMGIVYKAVDERIDRMVAIKTLQINDQVDDDQQTEIRKRFLQEAQFAGKVSHPNIVTIYDVAEENETPYIAMEFIDGQTLDQIIAEMDPDAPPRLEMMIDVMLQICEGLNHAHKNGIIHRDIKPSNIIVTKDGLAKIMDFGIARFSTSTNTIVGTVLGTPAYMSPEQISGRNVDHRSDIFSLGAVFYEFLTRKKAFPGNNITEVMYHVLNENPVPISATNSSVPAVFDNIIMRALRRSPEERYRSMEYFATDIRKLKQTLDLSRTIYLKADDFGAAPLPDWLKFLEPMNFKKLSMGLGIYSGFITILFLSLLIFGGERFGYIAQSLSKQHPAALLMKLNVPDAIVSIDGKEYPTGMDVLNFDSI
ncbi:serine/threonine protein kinase, partial [bacterium]|nr:serine/threonine protein kinase [bacterium]